MIGGWNTSPCRSRRQVERKPVLMWTWMTTWSTMDCCECAVGHDRRPNEGPRRPGGMRTRKKKWAESAEMENRPTHKQTKRTCVRALYRAEHTAAIQFSSFTDKLSLSKENWVFYDEPSAFQWIGGCWGSIFLSYITHRNRLAMKDHQDDQHKTAIFIFTWRESLSGTVCCRHFAFTGQKSKFLPALELLLVVHNVRFFPF